MNNILHLKGQFEQKSNSSSFGPKNLPVNGNVSVHHLTSLRNQLQKTLRFWETETLIPGALVSVHYKHVVAKSNRICCLLSKGKLKANDSIRGSKFEDENPQKHIFIHYVPLDVIQESINRIDSCIYILNNAYNGIISYHDIDVLNQKVKKYNYADEISLSNFIQVIIDAYFVERFDIDSDVDDIDEVSIVTLYETDIKTPDLLNKFGIDVIAAKMIDGTTIRLDPEELKILKDKAPYLIAMKTKDLSQITHEQILPCDNSIISIPDPTNEPIIGVIDTLFYEDVYFKKWVEYTNMLDPDIPTDIKDYEHGTSVSSIIVDGANINPNLDDGCGRFRVKHFGVATKGHFSSFTILKNIREIVSKNPNIKVWNLSLGSAMEINTNFISPEAAELDKIQCEYDVIFVVSGTNNLNCSKSTKIPRIGAPADSLNSVVVNAVDFNSKPVSYRRTGPVLSFFHKPDVSYYGGDGDQVIRVCTPTGEGFVTGTSFAAPWIARKIAFLIYNLGFSREVAKALIIDSAANWNRKDDLSHSIGYGIVPIRIEDIVKTSDDEIRFIMTGTTDSYETYTYNIPIPCDMDKHPFFARATLCYFPNCSRNQGVDYTNTEMDIHFGRVIEDKNGKPIIKSIDRNIQGDEGFNLIREESARKLYRKWDNIKHINDTIKTNSKPRKKYGMGLWGLSVKTKERLQTTRDRNTPFGVVVTLKEMNGVNRIDEFIKLCMIRGWVVNSIDIDNRINVYNKAEEEIIFE